MKDSPRLPSALSLKAFQERFCPRQPELECDRAKAVAAKEELDDMPGGFV
jgi:hypothetical protein